ncbi:Fc.00g085560.m01.CDS01 [Cosmosporella sp. VM-42]
MEDPSKHETRLDDVKREFGPSFVLHPPPEQQHTHTIVMLHGRGSDAEEFADEFLSSTLSDGRSLRDAFPGWRWVFPSSRELWSTTFQEHMPAWFEAYSLTDVTARQDLQVDGIKESVEYIQRVLDEELARLKGQRKRVLLGGISQGCAVAIWTLLCQHRIKLPCAFVGSSTWVPFGDNIERILPSLRKGGESEEVRVAGKVEEPVISDQQNLEYDNFVRTMMAPRFSTPQDQLFPNVPAMLGHGVDDAYVDVQLGRQAVRILEQAGFIVVRKEYEGAEQEGHWFKVPEQIDHMNKFFEMVDEIAGR